MQNSPQRGYNSSLISGDNELFCLSSQDEIKIYIDLTKEESAAVKNLVNPKDIIIFAGKVTKINERSLPQKRILVITNKTIYNIKHDDNVFFSFAFCSSTPGYSIKRRIKIEKISSITLSVHPFSKRQEFIINVKGEYDYYFNGGRKRDMIIESILTAHFLTPAEPFILYSREESDLSKFHTTKNDWKAKIDKRPSRDKILITPEIAIKGLEWIIYNRKGLIDYSHQYAGKRSNLSSPHKGFIEPNYLASSMRTNMGSFSLPFTHYNPEVNGSRLRAIDPNPRFHFNQSKNDKNDTIDTQSQSLASPCNNCKMDVFQDTDMVLSTSNYEITMYHES